MDRGDALKTFGYGSSDSPGGAELKSRYRRLARELHPDHNPGAGKRFTDLSHAYEILTDKCSPTPRSTRRSASDAEPRPVPDSVDFGPLEPGTFSDSVIVAVYAVAPDDHRSSPETAADLPEDDQITLGRAQGPFWIRTVLQRAPEADPPYLEVMFEANVPDTAYGLRRAPAKS